MCHAGTVQLPMGALVNGSLITCPDAIGDGFTKYLTSTFTRAQTYPAPPSVPVQYPPSLITKVTTDDIHTCRASEVLTENYGVDLQNPNLPPFFQFDWYSTISCTDLGVVRTLRAYEAGVGAPPPPNANFIGWDIVETQTLSDPWTIDDVNGIVSGIVAGFNLETDAVDNELVSFAYDPLGVLFSRRTLMDDRHYGFHWPNNYPIGSPLACCGGFGNGIRKRKCIVPYTPPKCRIRYTDVEPPGDYRDGQSTILSCSVLEDGDVINLDAPAMPLSGRHFASTDTLRNATSPPGCCALPPPL